MTLERRLFQRLRGFVFEQDEAEVRAIIKREVRRAVHLEFNPSRGAEITDVWLDEARILTVDDVRRAAGHPPFHTTGIAESVDERRPARATGDWDKAWRQALGDDAAKEGY